MKGKQDKLLKQICFKYFDTNLFRMFIFHEMFFKLILRIYIKNKNTQLPEQK